MIERIISRGLDAPEKFAPTLEKGRCTVTKRLANYGKVRVHVIHGPTLVIKN